MTMSLKSAAATALATVLSAAVVLDAGAVAAQSYGPGDTYGSQPNAYPAPPPGQYQGQYQQGQYPADRGAQDQDAQRDPYRSGPPPGQYDSSDRDSRYAPPEGQYAPPPPGAERSGSVYDDRAQQYDYDYGRRYSDWAMRNCEQRRQDNAAAGAIIGGVLGAVIGGGMSGRHDHGAGVVMGGALGAATGALIGSSSNAPGGCPPGYVLRSGAGGFAYEGPASAVFWAPAWYNPWVWNGGVWVYRPYRSWYFSHGAYWRPGWRPGRFEYRYRRW